MIRCLTCSWNFTHARNATLQTGSWNFRHARDDTCLTGSWNFTHARNATLLTGSWNFRHARDDTCLTCSWNFTHARDATLLTCVENSKDRFSQMSFLQGRAKQQNNSAEPWKKKGPLSSRCVPLKK